MIETIKIYEQNIENLQKLRNKDIVIYAISDLHLNSKIYNNEATLIGLEGLRNLIESEKRYGKSHILLLVGDIVDNSSFENSFDDNFICEKYIEKLKSVVNLFDIVLEVRGNHDEISLSKCIDTAKIMNIENKIVDFSDFVVYGYITSAKENIEELKRYLSEIKKLIIISHLPPYGKLDKSSYLEIGEREENRGDSGLRKIWEEIKNCIIICGHVARHGGKHEGNIFNIADFGCKIGRELNSWVTLKIEYDSKEKIIKYPQFVHPLLNFNSREEFIKALLNE